MIPSSSPPNEMADLRRRYHTETVRQSKFVEIHSMKSFITDDERYSNPRFSKSAQYFIKFILTLKPQ
jgi:hypothetical protein